MADTSLRARGDHGHVQVRESRQLLVEGNDGKNWFQALIERLSVDIQVHNYGGVNELRTFLLSFSKGPKFHTVTSLGIVQDSEHRREADAFKSVADAVAASGLPVPTAKGADGITGDGLAVGVMILPGSGESGMLESLLAKSLAGDPVCHCIETFMTCSTEQTGMEIRRPEKMFVHAFLATRPDPHVSVGVAARKGYWDFKHPAFEEIRRFLSALAER